MSEQNPIEARVDLRALWVSLLGMLFLVQFPHNVTITVGVSDPIAVVAVFAAMASGEWRRWRELIRNPLARWIFAFAGSILVSLLVSRFRLGHVVWGSLISRGLGLPLVLAIFCLFAVTPRERAWSYLRTLVVAGSLLNVAALVAVALRYGWNRGSVFFFGDTSLRLSGLMHNPNEYGGYLGLLLSVQLCALAFRKPLLGRRWMDGVNVAALLVASFFTISRGSWVAILAGALAVPLATRAHQRTTWRRVLLAPSFGVAVSILGLLLIARTGGLWLALRQSQNTRLSENATAIYFPRSAPSLSEFLRVAGDPAGAADRLAILRAALQLYASTPSAWLTGLGLGSFLELSPKTSLHTSVIIHNSFLFALIELGPLGAICLAGVLLTALRRLWHILLTDPHAGAAPAALFAAFTTFLVWCLSNEGLYQRHFWLLLGLTASLSMGRPEKLPGRVAEAYRTSWIFVWRRHLERRDALT